MKNAIADLDFRVYDIEDKISELLNVIRIAEIGNLQYVYRGFFISPTNGYNYYRIILTLNEGGSMLGKHWRFVCVRGTY